MLAGLIFSRKSLGGMAATTILAATVLLVAAMIGQNWKEVYDYALTHEFRFLSYGDGGLIRL